jgi:hypothetical protein
VERSPTRSCLQRHRPGVALGHSDAFILGRSCAGSSATSRIACAGRCQATNDVAIALFFDGQIGIAPGPCWRCSRGSDGWQVRSHLKATVPPGGMLASLLVIPEPRRGIGGDLMCDSCETGVARTTQRIGAATSGGRDVPPALRREGGPRRECSPPGGRGHGGLSRRPDHGHRHPPTRPRPGGRHRRRYSITDPGRQ